MGKYSGIIGFGYNKEIEPDIWKDEFVERHYYGDIIQNNRRFNQGTTLSGEVYITNQLSIVGDSFLFQNLSNIRYASVNGNNWIVESVQEKYPRVEISLGGVYNGKTHETKKNA